MSMASANVRKELLECSICLNIYTDPVMLRCGHNFCSMCIDRVLDTQEGAGRYSCPECRAECVERPVLIRNITLCNIVESFQPAQPDQEESGVFCSSCINSSVPAAKYCLHCEASLCDQHLKIHSKSPEHVFLDHNISLEIRKCSVHKELLKYYCTQDAASLCVSCRLDGEHQEHQVEMMGVASEKKKKILRRDLQELFTQREETENKIQRLQERKRKLEKNSARETERVAALFREIRRQLEDLEKCILSEVSRQEQQMSVSTSDVIQQLEMKMEKLSRKIHYIEELCATTDPLAVLQEPVTSDLCETVEEDNKEIDGHDFKIQNGGDLDVALISQTLHTLSNLVTHINFGICIMEPADITLDVNTASNKLHISDDRKTAVWTEIEQNRPQTPERFQPFNVLSSQEFSSGRYYWEFECSKEIGWKVGVSYPSIERSGDQSFIGNNNKSWCLQMLYNQYTTIHNNLPYLLPHNVSSNKFRICLDYEAGQLSFYELCEPIRHLHTFTATFTEPLHAAFGFYRTKEGNVYSSDWVRIQDSKGL
ncbi:E3 ubiquitin/ISG15 ligase TRIM25-like [Hyperolius riggenbachi]|uniref:E3 ubiquitin/ISG15 ligase TRIM25-like n=1 Tax=Hyperolius riggenbachi TaxID=752182 RepID=UPI0035A2F3E9